MKGETRIRNALIELYWRAHDDGRLCARDLTMKHLTDPEMIDRRKKVIARALSQIKPRADSKNGKVK